MSFAEIVVASNEAEAAQLAARWLYEQVQALAARGQNVRLALSGGKTPWAMLRAFVSLNPPWRNLDIFQVDERFVPTYDSRSNAGQIARILPPDARFWPIPTNTARTPEEAAQEYERTLVRHIFFSHGEGDLPSLDTLLDDRAGGSLFFDVAHLGLGQDGHTASLVPGDSILSVLDRAVAATNQPYQGVRRVSVTYPVLQRSKQLLWLVTGRDKKRILERFLAGDPSLPASRLSSDHATLFTDSSAREG